jgi:tetratricopeptide (TPR) repeat protein
MNRFVNLFALGFLLLACPLVQAQPAAAQTNGDHQPDEREIATRYSLYFENYKNKNYEDALPDLRWILAHAPGFPGNRDKNFERMIDIYEAMAESTPDAATKRAYLDSAIVMHHQVITTMKELGGELDEFVWTRERGKFIQKHLEDLDDIKGQVAESYLEAYEMDKMRLEPYYINVILYDYYSQGDIGALLELLEELIEIRGEEPKIKELLETYWQFIDPEQQIIFLEKKLEDNPDDVEATQKLCKLYQDEQMRDEMIEVCSRLMEMEPTPEILRMIIPMKIADGEYEEALVIFEQLKGMPGVTINSTDHFNAGVAEQGLERYARALQQYNQALRIAEDDSTRKKALSAVANAYATAMRSCNPTERKDRAVYWLIADAFIRAGDTNSANSYRPVFPSAEDIFYENSWTEGQQTSVSYTCRGITMSGTTTVRQGN